MSKIGIVILNYNDFDTTKEMIEQISTYKSIDNIIVVDNKSTDNSYDKLKKIEKNNINVIQTDSNKGYASGNNYGIKFLVDNYDVDYIIISNPDIIVKEEVIKKIKKDFDENKDISMLSPIIHELGRISRGWKLPRFIDELLSNINYIHKIAIKRTYYNEEHYNNSFSKVDVVSGCFFAIRKDIFEQIGYFDEGTFLYYEENIIGKKLKNINKETYIDNEISVIHNLSISVNKNINSLKKYKILKQSQRYYQKKYNKLNVFGIFLLYITYLLSLFVSYILFLFSKLKK